MRSTWEMNYAHYLDWLKKKKEIKKWEYEPDTFWFKNIRRGTCSYLPDFKIYQNPINGKLKFVSEISKIWIFFIFARF